jgi:hypothetical protein
MSHVRRMSHVRSQFKHTRRRLAAVLLATSLLAGGLFTVLPAIAATTCTSNLQQIVQPGLDNFRAGLKCSQITVNNEVRAVLARNGGPDYYSAWFHNLNTWHYSSWYTCYLGCWADKQERPR